MEINDPELLTKPAATSVLPFKMMSLFCRNDRHISCKWGECECGCHKANAERLKQQLLCSMDHIHD